MDLVIVCDKLTSKLAKTEIYGLSSPIKTAVISIAANIAQGKGRRHRAGGRGQGAGGVSKKSKKF